MDSIMIYPDENGVFHEYKDDYDIVIHCETKEDYDTCYETIKKGQKCIKIIENLQNDLQTMYKNLPTTDGYIKGYKDALSAVFEYIEEKE